MLLNLVGPSPAKLELDGVTTWPLLIDLGKLNSGVYNLHVVVVRPGHSNHIFGRLQFTVREPKPWTGSIPSATPFSVRVSPAAPSLEDIWEEQAMVELLGPSDRRVEVAIRFYSSSSPEPILAQTIGSVVLPCPQSRWSDLWTSITNDRKFRTPTMRAPNASLSSIARNWADLLLRASRESSPVRWIVKQENSGYFLKLALLDDQAETSLAHYSFRSPAESSPMSVDPITGFRVSEGGGLFAAITEKYRTAIIVPPAIHSLKWLSVVVSIFPRQHQSEADARSTYSPRLSFGPPRGPSAVLSLRSVRPRRCPRSCTKSSECFAGMSGRVLNMNIHAVRLRLPI